MKQSVHEIRLLERSEWEEWHALLEESAAEPLFSTQPWVDRLAKAFGGEAEVLGRFEGGELGGGIALPVRKRGGIAVATSPYLMPYFAIVSRANHRRMIRSLLPEITRRYSLVNLCPSPAESDLRPYFSAGWSAALRYTSRLSLEGETAESILQECRSSRMMFLDDALRPERLRMTLAAGAHGYWTKQASFDQLCEAICRLASGGTSVCPAARRYLVGCDGHLRFDQTADGTPLAGITRRERQVLVLLAEGLSVRQAAERLCLSPRTVDSHRSNLMKKLGIHKIVDLVRLALREGLIND